MFTTAKGKTYRTYLKIGYVPLAGVISRLSTGW